VGAPLGPIVPCRIVVDSSTKFGFQVQVAYMPLKIKLCEDHRGNPATSSSFNTVGVFNALTSPISPVNGQPTAVTATAFSIDLSPGAYDINMDLNYIPGAQVAFVYENCGGLNQLARIPILIMPSGTFSLRVY
jgi:hypothetical protein